MKREINSNTSATVLIFNPMKRLVGMFCSITSAAKALRTTPTNVLYACDGHTISCRGLYVRQIPEDIEIEPDDYGKLKLEDFDQMCGISRKYYPNQKMNRAGMKYNMRPNRKNQQNENQTLIRTGKNADTRR